MATRIAMMATTISISIRLKPFLLVTFLSRVKFLLLLKFYLYRPERGGRPGRYQIYILPYMENMGRYTASSNMTVMTASPRMMTGSRTASSRSVMVAASWSK